MACPALGGVVGRKKNPKKKAWDMRLEAKAQEEESTDYKFHKFFCSEAKCLNPECLNPFGAPGTVHWASLKIFLKICLTGGGGAVV